MGEIMGVAFALSKLADYSVPVAALFVSLVTLMYSAVAMHRQSKTDLTSHLYDRIEQLEREIEATEEHAERLRKKCDELENQLRQIREENFLLMRRLIRMGGEE